MTDLERFKELYLSFGITLKEEPDTSSIANPGDVVIWIDEGDSPMLVGYMGFCSGVFFDAHGKFIKQGFWE